MMKKSLLIIPLILLIYSVKSFSQDFNEITNKQDTIVLKNFWINPKYYQGDKRIYVRDFKSIMQNDQAALNELKKAKTLRFFGYSMAALGGGFIGAGLPNSYSDANSDLIITGSIIAGCAIVIDYFAESKFRDVIRIYNRNLRTTNINSDMSLKIGLGLSTNGLCLKLTF